MRRKSFYAWRPGELLVGLLVAASAAPTFAQTAIKGSVRDKITGAPVCGADVEVRHGSQTWRAVTKSPDGTFLVTVDVGNHPEARNLKVVVSREKYVPCDGDVVIVSARPTVDLVRLELLRSEVAECMRNSRPRWVVVGHFRPPSAGGVTELEGRLTDAIRYELAKIAQAGNLAADRRPVVVPCSQIDEREFLSDTAKTLQADALISGDVSPANNRRFRVRMFLGDQHDLFHDMAPVVSRDVDLDDPEASHLAPEAATRILQALLVGYQKARQWNDCVDLCRRAAAELRPLPDSIAKINAQCTANVAANGLRGPP